VVESKCCELHLRAGHPQTAGNLLDALTMGEAD
jgi:hypothetical protein